MDANIKTVLQIRNNLINRFEAIVKILKSKNQESINMSRLKKQLKLFLQDGNKYISDYTSVKKELLNNIKNTRRNLHVSNTNNKNKSLSLDQLNDLMKNLQQELLNKRSIIQEISPLLKKAYALKILTTNNTNNYNNTKLIQSSISNLKQKKGNLTASIIAKNKEKRDIINRLGNLIGPMGNAIKNKK